MIDHARYTSEHCRSGTVLVAGPVFAPEGSFGVAVLAVPDEAAARAFADNDPSVLAKMNTYEIYPMRVLDPNVAQPAS
jgi:uncharacterized protein YciI